MAPETIHRNRCDAIVLGAGPAGTSCAAILAEAGRDVVILEKEQFPRYRVGESLVPYCWFPLNRLGLIQKLDSCAFMVRKQSVQFVGLDGKVSTPFYFFKHTDHDCARTWQVVRSDFDQMLLDNALAKGARVQERTAARELIQENGAVVGVRAEDGEGRSREWRAPITIDATGRDSFAARSLDWRVPDPELKKIAIWTYYKGAMRDPGLDAGATTVAYVPDKGWFWYIPLPEDTVSVGIVADRDYLYSGPRDPDAIFAREVQVQPWIQQHLACGEKVAPCRVTGDYSYRSRHCATDGLILTGDAFAFLDPVFSSGVFLALQGGIMAAQVADEALRAGDVSAARFTEYGRTLCRGIEAMRNLVYAFYDNAFSFADFLRAHPDLKDDLTDCLICNLFQDFDPLFKAVADFAGLPQRLDHGGPLLAGTGAGASVECSAEPGPCPIRNPKSNTR